MLSFGTVSSLFRGSGLEGEIRRAGAPSKCPRGSASPPVPRAAAGRAGPEPGGAAPAPGPPLSQRHGRGASPASEALLPRGHGPAPAALPLLRPG